MAVLWRYAFNSMPAAPRSSPQVAAGWLDGQGALLGETASVTAAHTLQHRHLLATKSRPTNRAAIQQSKQILCDVFLLISIESICNFLRHDGSLGHGEITLLLCQSSLCVACAAGQRSCYCWHGEKSMDDGISEARAPKIHQAAAYGCHVA
eukprot:s1544_g2.t1